MGRILDLCGEIAEMADEGPEGLVLPADAWERFRADWSDEEIEDALALVQENLLQSDLVESADSLNARLLELLGSLGEASAFRQAAAEGMPLTVEVIGQLARRVARLEEVLEGFRDGAPPDRRGFDALQRRLADHGIEDEMRDPLRLEQRTAELGAGDGDDDDER
jgi:hypothetical protein